MPTPCREVPPLRNKRPPEDISKHSCLSDRHVSVKKATSQSHTSNSASRSSQRDWSRILCKFFVNTCSRMNSGWRVTSLVAWGYSVGPIPRTSFLWTPRLPSCPYSISSMKDSTASRTEAPGTVSCNHESSQFSLTEATTKFFPETRALTLNNL